MRRGPRCTRPMANLNVRLSFQARRIARPLPVRLGLPSTGGKWMSWTSMAGRLPPARPEIWRSTGPIPG